MKTRFMIEDPDKIEATMKITMTVAEWCEVRDQLRERELRNTSRKLVVSINEVIEAARKVYYATEETPPAGG